MIKAVVFDLDGTIVNTIDLWVKVWGETLEKYGMPIPKERVRALIGLPPKMIIADALGRECEPEREREMIEYRTKLLWEYAYMAKPFDDVKPEMQKIKNRHIKIGVASTSNDAWIKEMLERVGISELVNCYVSATKVKNPKPAPDVFVEAFRLLGTAPAEGMVVGDRESDTIPALSIGAVSVLIDRFGEFSKPRADFTIHSMAELEQIISKT
ncbi:MAG: HAD family phosphatase [Candidatus Micrarchaeaceae archaeon]